VKARRPELSDIRAARGRVSQIAINAPLVLSELSSDPARPAWLKLEITQPTGSFKIRGATNAIAQLSDEQRGRGVVCCSTGNHGRAVAYAASRFGVEATVCLSHLVPDNKVRAIEKLGATVLRIGESQDDAQHEADELVEKRGLVEIPPFDHFDVICGQGTIGIEILEEQPDIDCLLVPLSGGGLISGIAIAAKAIKPSVRVVGLSMDRGAAMSASLAAGRPVEVSEFESLADSLGGGIGLANRFTFDTCHELVDEVILLGEEEIYRGMQAVFYEDRFVVEGGAAVAHAALLAGKVSLDEPTAIILSGRNVDPRQFADVVSSRPVKLGNITVHGD
jgi:threonine dehydratase